MKMASTPMEDRPRGVSYGSLEITVARLKLRLLEEAVLPPFKGSTFRGLLGKSLLDAWCPYKREECTKCARNAQCPYPNFFKPHLSRGGKSIPAPFLIDPKPDRRTYLTKGDVVEFALNFFGWGVNWFPFVMAAIWRGGERGLLGVKRARFRLEFPEMPARPDEPSAWANISNGMEKISTLQVTRRKGRVEAIRLLTPCKLKEEGRVIGKPDGRTLITALQRRIGALVHFYGEKSEIKENPAWKEAPFLVTGEEELRWVVLERPSFTQGERVNIGGWVGTIHVESHNEEAGFLLRVGEWSHVGKNTVLGCGKIALEERAQC